MNQRKRPKNRRAKRPPLANGSYVPHVIEPSAGVDRLALALICNAYCEDQAPDEKGKMEKRVVMRFSPASPRSRSPSFRCSRTSPNWSEKALEVRDLLRPLMTVFYDEAARLAGVTGGRMKRARPLA
jgi:glycyl-tRNA synthetase